ncbi:hypothetical protein PN497_02290 [Sphaerospermopsis kisseleviana CS-549]|uniref:Uncharacterized protein n=1 Tax=Sphaerospermopsis kisseleviana CS-549 TaxID=3021783 RepID=A0ABT4ZN27_9CYAN|nr:DUF6572 domain-containing protein [Sphaerospermopsis kisseleviana]MDB9440213.1 hypothetical protein [Sphaerospermopsis kisseleviana CS-549]BAZ82650.1 hypothetical protein NIES73_39330 [Sphaerospermopsis kisseleviana NIES-73]
MSVENPEIIDAVIYNYEEQKIGLVIIVSKHWNEYDDILDLLNNKINMYVYFVQSKQLEETYPEYNPNTVFFQIESIEKPPLYFIEGIEDFNKQLKQYNLYIEIGSN